MKAQAPYEGLRVLPLKAMECGFIRHWFPDSLLVLPKDTRADLRRIAQATGLAAQCPC